MNKNLNYSLFPYVCMYACMYVKLHMNFVLVSGSVLKRAESCKGTDNI
jgi:hypothetical protein